jgi:hypothetical protein
MSSKSRYKRRPDPKPDNERRELVARMLEHAHTRRNVFTGPGANNFKAVVDHFIDRDGHAERRKLTAYHIDQIFKIMQTVADTSGGHWEHAVDLDTGRVIAVIRDGPVDPNRCATDLAYGFNTVGLPDDFAHWAPMLNRGGTMMLPCPDCENFEQTHILAVHKADDGYTVEAI